MLYQLQEGSKYFNKHENEGYKFYSFSNIFPAQDVKTGEERSCLIASPDQDFIEWLYGKFSVFQQEQKVINIGEMQFTISRMSYIKQAIRQGVRLITGTPVVMRIPKQKYKEYGIESERPYEYWRPEHDFNAFVSQLHGNLVKKYEQYYGKKTEIASPFEQFKFKKSVCVHRIEQGREQKTIGSLWEFKFSNPEPEQKKLLWLGLESGFGELNSSGFGFMNVVKNGDN